MKINEVLSKTSKTTKYDFYRIPDTNTFVATADGEEIGRFEGKSKFDSGAAQDEAKKLISAHRSAAVKRERDASEHQAQFGKPLSDIEKMWLQMHKQLYIDRLPGNEDDYNRYVRFGGAVRKSISSIDAPETHPLAKDYLATL